MALLFIVKDRLEVNGRGVLVVGQPDQSALVRIRIGEPIEVRTPDGRCLVSAFRGFGHVPAGADWQVYLLSEELTLDDVPLGAQIWSIESQFEEIGNQHA